MRGFVSKRTRQRRREYPPLALAARGSSRDIPCGPPTKKGRRVVARRPVSSWNGRRLYSAAPSVASAPAAAASSVASVASPAASPATAAAGSAAGVLEPATARSEEHTSELQSLMRISYAVFCLKKKKHNRSTENVNR